MMLFPSPMPRAFFLLLALFVGTLCQPFSAGAASFSMPYAPADSPLQPSGGYPGVFYMPNAAQDTNLVFFDPSAWSFAPVYRPSEFRVSSAVYACHVDTAGDMTNCHQDDTTSWWQVSSDEPTLSKVFSSTTDAAIHDFNTGDVLVPETEYSTWFSSTPPLPTPSFPPSTFHLPYPLPYHDGATQWQSYIAIRNTDGWTLIYHNSDLSADPNGYLVASPHFTESNPIFISDMTGDGWSESSGNTFFVNDTSFFIDTNLQSVGGSPCRQKLFASRTIFAMGTYEPAAQYCTDIIPYHSGDVLFDRVNFDPTGALIGITPPATTTIVDRQPTGNYVDVPNLLDDPSGFVGAFLTNLSIWIYSLFIPSSSFFLSEITGLRLDLLGAFPWYTQIHDSLSLAVTAFSTATAPTCQSVMSNELTFSIYGSQPIVLLDCTLIDPYISTFRFWAGNFAIFFAGAYAFRRSAKLLSV